MKDLINKLLASFDTETKGFSARKLSALAGVLTGIYITLKLIPETEQIDALYAWLAFSLLCLGIVTIEQILKLKNGNPPPQQPE